MSACVGHGSSALETLPDDVLGLILRRLDIDELLRLQALSSVLRDRISTLGIPLYLSLHPSSHITVHPPQSAWPPYDLIKHNTYISRSLKHRRWHALQIGPTWPQRVIPVMSLSPERLVLGVGGKVLVHPMVLPGSSSSTGRGQGGGMRAVGRSREYSIAKRYAGSGADVMGLAQLDDGQIMVAQYDGTVQRLQLPSRENGLPGIRSTAHWSHPKGSNLHAFAADGERMMTITSAGLVSLWKANSPWIPASTLQLSPGARVWSSLLATNPTSRTPVALLGLPGGIDVLPIRPTGLERKPSRRLLGPDPPSTSSPYGLLLPPYGTSHSPSLLLSAWYDSHLRLHDLRSPSSSPVAEFSDPYTWAEGSAMYSCAFVSESYLAGGGARHGTVSFFDVRQPRRGWSCFTPGGKGSPVYAMAGEGGRAWGVTERRAFVLAFDGSGRVELDSGGLVLPEARAVPEKAEERPTRWKGRGGRWGWTVRYSDEREAVGGDTTRGYEHAQGGVKLLESLPVP